MWLTQSYIYFDLTLLSNLLKLASRFKLRRQADRLMDGQCDHGALLSLGE